MSYINRSVRFAHARRKTFEMKVQNGLSLTPAEMMKLAKEGMPIAAASPLQESFDNTPQGDFFVPLETRRGIDIADLYAAQQDSKNKLRRLKSDRAAAAAAQEGD